MAQKKESQLDTNNLAHSFFVKAKTSLNASNFSVDNALAGKIAEHAGVPPEEARKLLHNMIDNISDRQLTNFQAAHISVIV
jgi:hypothetical protein